ncbi:hypothetical protein ACN47E_001847 [Coniothyrium glycines]
MPTLSTISAELQLLIIELLNCPPSSFIPRPNADLLSLSLVDKSLRALVLPNLFCDVTLVNDEKCGSSVKAILTGAAAGLVKNLHYIGIKSITLDFETPISNDDDSTEEPSSALPDSVAYVLSNLSRLPNLEKLTVEFRVANTEEEDQEQYREIFYDYFDDLDTGDDTIELERQESFRLLVKHLYASIARNPPSTIKHLELKNTIAKECSVWHTSGFQAILQNLVSFTLSIRGGDMGAESGVNVLQGYQDFVRHTNVYFFRHVHRLENLSFSASADGLCGLSGVAHIPLPLQIGDMANLRNLQLRHVFISIHLVDFLIAHGESLQSIELHNASSGLGCELAQDAISWTEFFSAMATNECKALRSLIVDSALEKLKPDAYDSEIYQEETAIRAHDLRQKFPGRRMFDYAELDMKYGTLYPNDREAFPRFVQGDDHRAWEQLMQVIAGNS